MEIKKGATRGDPGDPEVVGKHERDHWGLRILHRERQDIQDLTLQNLPYAAGVISFIVFLIAFTDWTLLEIIATSSAITTAMLAVALSVLPLRMLNKEGMRRGRVLFVIIARAIIPLLLFISVVLFLIAAGLAIPDGLLHIRDADVRYFNKFILGVSTGILVTSTSFAARWLFRLTRQARAFRLSLEGLRNDEELESKVLAIINKELRLHRHLTGWRGGPDISDREEGAQ